MRAVIAGLCLVALGSLPLRAQPSGKAIFEGKGNCHTCHGRNARGTPLAPDLTDGEWLNIDGSAAAIRTVVQQGVAKPKKYPAPMPPMGGARLKAEEVDAVAAYVVSLSRGAAAERAERSAAAATHAEHSAHLGAVVPEDASSDAALHRHQDCAPCPRHALNGSAQRTQPVPSRRRAGHHRMSRSTRSAL